MLLYVEKVIYLYMYIIHRFRNENVHHNVMLNEIHFYTYILICVDFMNTKK